MYTNEIKHLLMNDWYYLVIALFLYWVINGELLTITDTLCRKKIRNQATARAVSVGLIPFVIIYTGSMMKLMPMFNHWHLGINILLSLVSVMWMIAVYYLFDMVRDFRQRILLNSRYSGWYLTRKGRLHMALVAGFMFTDIFVKTLLYRLGISNQTTNYRFIQADISAILTIHYNGPLPKWFIKMTNFVIDCYVLNGEYRVDYHHNIGKQASKEDIEKISDYTDKLARKALLVE